MSDQYLTFIGLAIDFIGALILLSGVFVTKKKAIEIGAPRWAYENDEGNIKLPSVANLIAESRRAVFGSVLLVIGFLLQAVAAWPF